VEVVLSGKRAAPRVLLLLLFIVLRRRRSLKPQQSSNPQRLPQLQNPAELS